MTTREPRASEVLMCFLTLSPASTAFFASRPAASSTLGLEVLVQDVMAAMSTSPSTISMPSLVLKLCCRRPAGWLKPLSATGLANSDSNWLLTPPSSMRSCGRFGPASEGRRCRGRA